MNCVPSVILIQLDTSIMKIPGSAMYIVVTLIRAYISRWIKRTGDEKIVIHKLSENIPCLLNWEITHVPWSRYQNLRFIDR